MAGLLSSMFHPDQGSDHHATDSHGTDHHTTTPHTSHEEPAHHDRVSGTSDHHDIGGHADISPSVSLHMGMNGSMDTTDGSIHSWSNTQDVDVTADADAVFGVTQS